MVFFLIRVYICWRPVLHFYVLIWSVLGFNTESQETFQCPVLACHAKIVHQLLLFSVEMLIYLENTLFLLIMYYISCFIHSVLCDLCRWFSQGSVIVERATCYRLGGPGIESLEGDFLQLSRPAALPASCTMGIGSLSRGWSMVLMPTTI